MAAASGDTAAVTRTLQPLKYEEQILTGLKYTTNLEQIYVTGQSDFQDIKLLRTSTFGKCLVLDNQIQSALTDEANYHEALVHPAMLSHPDPKRVFIGGGGEGATAREVLRHTGVERLLMSDLDQKVCEFCREHMPEWNAGVWEDPRFECVYEDAKAKLEACAAAGERFDVIIMDICDPLDAGPGWMLYTQEFYAECRDKYLTPNGVIVTQSTSADPGAPGSPENDDPFAMLNKTLGSVFTNVRSYSSEVPSFYYPWGFTVASNADALLGPEEDPAKIDGLLAKRLSGEQVAKLRHYDGIGHRHMFNLTKGARARIARETRTFKMSEPLFCAR